MKLSEFKRITSLEYASLDLPEYLGQSKLDNKGSYYTCWRTKDNKLVKVKSKIK